MEAKLNLIAGLKNDLPDVPYAQLVCALLFIARCTRPNILFSVTFLCRYLTNYTTSHLKAAIRVLTYLKCAMDFKLSSRVPSSDVQPVETYIDSDWGGDKETGGSTASGVLFLYGNPVSWFCQKQDCVSHSTSEAESVFAFKECMYFINLLQSDMNIQIIPVQTHIDNIGAAYMAEQVATNKRTTRISLSYHYAREQVQKLENYVR
jgi:histone deacetylase 1/2